MATKFLDAHFARIRDRLVAEADTAKSFHHGLSQGLIRETFIREFLEQNISPLWRIGTGEILHKDMLASEQRNQIDIIIYNSRYPRISLSKGIDLFFMESVSTFMEVKSTLKKEDVKKFASVTKQIKSQVSTRPHRFNLNGQVKTPRPYSLMFSYDGPKKAGTIKGWMKEISNEDDYKLEALRSIDPKERFFHPHMFIDGIFVLQRGYAYVDTLPFQSPLVGNPDISRDHMFVFGKNRELFLLWALISELNQLLFWNEWEVFDYLDGVTFEQFLSD